MISSTDYRTTELSTFPASARIWIYQANRELTANEVEAINNQSAAFIQNWAAHGTAMKASMEVLHDRFVVLCADEAVMKATGCSIDASVHFIQNLGRAIDVDFFDRMSVCYLDGQGEIHTCKMTEVKALLESGSLTPESQVFNNLVATKGEFVEGWKTSLKSTWLSRYL